MIRFYCKNCGQKIAVKDNYADRRGKCPKCKNIIVVPKAQSRHPVSNQSTPEDAGTSSPETDLDLTLLEVPKKYKAQEQTNDQSDISNSDLHKLYGYGFKNELDKTKKVAKRKLPWLIDIFLYPANKPSLTVLGIIIVIPLLIWLLLKVLSILATAFPPFIVFLVGFGVIGGVIRIILGLYMYWYFCECIRDSAAGGLRGPETLATTPGLGEMLWQLIRVVGCAAVFLLPALIYFMKTKNIDTLFWVLLGCGGFIFPMGLLGVIMFDSFSALNPILIFGSIFSTFFPYLGLVLLYYVLSNLPITAALLYRKEIIPQSQLLLFIIRGICLYMMLIAGHLLGRFFWRYEEKLNWEV